MQPAHLPEQVEAARIVLRRVTAPLAADTRAALAAEPARFLAYFPLPRLNLSPTEVESGFLSEAESLWQRFEEYAYEIRERSDESLVGHASVHKLEWKHECAELAYWVRQSAEGKGYASAAVTCLERMLFERGFHRVEIRCDVRNLASRRVAERCGYTLEGTLRGHMKRLDGSYRDSYVLGKLASEA